MNYTEYDDIELIKRSYAISQVRNLMGRYVYCGGSPDQSDVYDLFWVKSTKSPVMGQNHGFYSGEESIRKFYKAVQKANPGNTGVHERAISSYVIEIARDMQTAKGVWYAHGLETGKDVAGKDEGWWTFEKYAVDFALEDDNTAGEARWKIWHLITGTDFYSKAGQRFGREDGNNEMGIPGVFLSAMPQPDIPAAVYDLNFGFRKVLEMPEPYTTFSETFSYGPSAYGLDIAEVYNDK